MVGGVERHDGGSLVTRQSSPKVEMNGIEGFTGVAARVEVLGPAKANKMGVGGNAPNALFYRKRGRNEGTSRLEGFKANMS